MMHELNKPPINKIDFEAIADGAPIPEVGDETLEKFYADGIPLIKVAKIQEFKDIEEFGKHFNNFWLYFDFSSPEDMENVFKMNYATPPWARRFQIAYPDEFKELCEELNNYIYYYDSEGNLVTKATYEDIASENKYVAKGYRPTARGHDEDLIRKFFGAYKIMSHLVDKGDKDAKDTDGIIIEDILTK